MSETIISVAIITALFNGGALLFKQLFSRNENKALQYSHEERLIELVSKQNDSSEKLIASIEGLRGDLKDLSERVSRLEEKELDPNS